MKWTSFLHLALLGVAVSISGCNGGGGSDTATMNLGVADTPVDSATSVVITFTGVELHGASGTTDFTFSAPRHVDLMTTSNGNAASLLSDETIPAGNYQWIRLVIDPSQSTISLDDGSVHPLTISSGDQTGLKLVSGFTVAAGSVANFTIDFDLRQAITLANGDYKLKPALRLLNNQEVGQISGTASNTMTIGGTSIASDTCRPAVYIYSGSNVTPVDIDPDPTLTVQPVTTASLILNKDTGDYEYTAAFLAPDEYTLAVTCAANDDSSASDKDLAFSPAKNASVVAGETTTVNFP